MKLPTKILENAVTEISKLPGIGKKTALRLSLYLLKKDSQFSKDISKAITDLKEKTRFCHVCHMICDEGKCYCQNESTSINRELLCVVEDTLMYLQYKIQTTITGYLCDRWSHISYRWNWTENLNIESLVRRIDKGEIKEIIFALSPTLDGDTTSFYISKTFKV